MNAKETKPKMNAGRIVLIVVALVFCVWFALSLLTGEPATVGNLTGIGVFGLLALYGFFMPHVNGFLKRLWKTKGGKVLEILVGLILAVIFSLAIFTYGCILHAAGDKAEPEKAVIVLGCKVNNGHPSLTLQYRLEAALEYLLENPDSVCVVSGAQGPRETTTEASVMYQWLAEKGIRKDRILLEEKATDTLENLQFSKALLETYSVPTEKIAIATSDFHMYRSVRNAKNLGMDAGAISAKTPWWLYPTYVVREMYGILESWFLN